MRILEVTLCTLLAVIATTPLRFDFDIGGAGGGRIATENGTMMIDGGLSYHGEMMIDPGTIGIRDPSTKHVWYSNGHTVEEYSGDLNSKLVDFKWLKRGWFTNGLHFK